MNLHRLDLVSLSLFTRVVRSGSISGGAERAELAVGAASKRISDLEAALGTVLLERHSRGVTPTAAGRALLLHAQRILADVDALTADLSDHAQGVVGLVRLWANTSAITQFLPAGMASFAQAHPGIRIELHESDSGECAMAAVDGRADFAIFADRTPALGLQTLRYCTDHLVLVVPARHVLARRRRLAFAEVMDHDFVSLSPGTSLAQRLAEEAAQLGRSLRPRVHVRSFDAMCQMVAAGLGIAVLPERAIQPHLQSMGLRRIELTDAWVARDLLVGARDLTTLARPARALLDHLVAAAQA